MTTQRDELQLRAIAESIVGPGVQVSNPDQFRQFLADKYLEFRQHQARGIQANLAAQESQSAWLTELQRVNIEAERRIADPRELVPPFQFGQQQETPPSASAFTPGFTGIGRDFLPFLSIADPVGLVGEFAARGAVEAAGGGEGLQNVAGVIGAVGATDPVDLLRLGRLGVQGAGALARGVESGVSRIGGAVSDVAADVGEAAERATGFSPVTTARAGLDEAGDVARRGSIEFVENFPLNEAARSELASEVDDIAQQVMANSGIRKVQVDPPYTFELSQQAGVAGNGVMRVNPTVQNVRQSMLHEAGHVLWERATPAQQAQLRALVADNLALLRENSPGYVRQFEQGDDVEAVAQIFAQIHELPEQYQRALLEFQPSGKTFDEAFPQVDHVEVPRSITTKTARSWDEIKKGHGQITEQDDLAETARLYGDRMIVIKDVNGGRSVLPASQAARLLDDPMGSGFVRSVFMPSGHIPLGQAIPDGYTLNFLPQFKEAVKRATTELPAAPSREAIPPPASAARAADDALESVTERVARGSPAPEITDVTIDTPARGVVRETASEITRASDEAMQQTGPISFLDSDGVPQRGVPRVVEKGTDLPSDITGDIPPRRPIVTDGLPPEGDRLLSLQDFQTQLDVAFNPGITRRIGEVAARLRIPSFGFDPSLKADTAGKRAVIALANLYEEGKLKATRAFATVDELGTVETVFDNELDEFGTFSDGQFKGRSPNEVAEQPALRNRATPAQQEYLDRLTRLDELSSQMAREAGRDIGLLEDEELLFASRRVWAKVDTDTGEIIRAEPAPQARQGIGGKMAAERSRVVREAEQLRKDGFILLPYDETVKLKVQQAYRISAEAELERWVRKNFDVETPVGGRRNFVEAQQRVFREMVGSDDRARDFVRELQNALEEFRRGAPEGGGFTIIQNLNLIGRSFELAFDASLFGIQLLINLFEDLSPVAFRGGIRKPRAKIPLRTTVPTAKTFATQLVRGMFDPARARRFNQEQFLQNTDLLQSARSLILFGADESGELLEGFGKVQSATDFLAKKGKVGRVGAIVTRPIEAFQQAFSAAMNTAGIKLFDAFLPLARNADGTIDPKKLQDVEDFVNNLRGITSSARLGVSSSRRWNESLALLAPRYRRATASLYVSAAQGGIRGNTARNAIASAMTGITMAFAGIVIARGLAEGKPEARIKHELENTLIPGGGSYLVTEVNGQMVGPGSKLVQDARFIAKFFTQPKDFTSFDIQNNPGIRWVRGQTSFVVGDALDILLGRDVVGNPTRPGPAIDGTDIPQREGLIGLAKVGVSYGTAIWIQSAAFEGGDFDGRATRAGSDFIGGRAYQQGRWQVLENVSWERFGKPLEDLNQLERFNLENDPEIAPVLQKFDEERARSGDKFAHYRIQRNSNQAWGYIQSQEDLNDLIEELALNGSKGAKKPDGTRGPNAWDTLNKLADRVGETKGIVAARNDQVRREHNMTGHTGEEPTNEFDIMLNGWYQIIEDSTQKLIVKGQEESGRLDFDKWIPKADAFIASLSPELKAQLQEWRDRKESVPGLDEILALRQPIGTKQSGAPDYRSPAELFAETMEILEREIGLTADKWNSLVEEAQRAQQ